MKVLALGLHGSHNTPSPAYPQLSSTEAEGRLRLRQRRPELTFGGQLIGSLDEWYYSWSLIIRLTSKVCLPLHVHRCSGLHICGSCGVTLVTVVGILYELNKPDRSLEQQISLDVHVKELPMKIGHRTESKISLKSVRITAFSLPARPGLVHLSTVFPSHPSPWPNLVKRSFPSLTEECP